MLIERNEFGYRERGQDAEDRDHHHQFNKRESTRLKVLHVLLRGAFRPLIDRSVLALLRQELIAFLKDSARVSQE